MRNLKFKVNLEKFAQWKTKLFDVSSKSRLRVYEYLSYCRVEMYKVDSDWNALYEKVKW